jgi:hypothetical protein
MGTTEGDADDLNPAEQRFIKSLKQVRTLSAILKLQWLIRSWSFRFIFKSQLSIRDLSQRTFVCIRVCKREYKFSKRTGFWK